MNKRNDQEEIHVVLVLSYGERIYESRRVEEHIKDGGIAPCGNDNSKKLVIVAGLHDIDTFGKLITRALALMLEIKYDQKDCDEPRLDSEKKKCQYSVMDKCKEGGSKDGEKAFTSCGDEDLKNTIGEKKVHCMNEKTTTTPSPCTGNKDFCDDEKNAPYLDSIATINETSTTTPNSDCKDKATNCGNEAFAPFIDLYCAGDNFRQECKKTCNAC